MPKVFESVSISKFNLGNMRRLPVILTSRGREWGVVVNYPVTANDVKIIAGNLMMLVEAKDGD